MKKILLILLSSLGLFSSISGADRIVSWNPNQEPDLAGYRLYWGTTSKNYTEKIDLGNRNKIRILDLIPNTVYYFALTAYDIANNESSFSDEVTTTIGNDEDIILIGDFNNDNRVDGLDMIIFDGNFGKSK
jgi:hypothetical protein